VKIGKIFYAVPLLVSVIVAPVLAGSNYKLKYDKFENNKSAEYDLSVGSECRLTQTSKSTLSGCDFITVSTDPSSPSVILHSMSDRWDIMYYRNISPYSENLAPVIITYKNGNKMNTKLPALFKGTVVRGGTVLESIIVRLGRIKQDLVNIDNIELKYGSNEYYIKFDDQLTVKALNYQE
jgi:hypothetical protein